MRSTGRPTSARFCASASRIFAQKRAVAGTLLTKALATINMHSHNFETSQWPFNCPENMGCITTVQVLEQNLPILAVLHDEEGTWQLLCETTEDPKHGNVMCLGCMFERFPFIGAFAELEPGYEAVRKSPEHEWEIRKTNYD